MCDCFNYGVIILIHHHGGGNYITVKPQPLNVGEQAYFYFVRLYLRLFNDIYCLKTAKIHNIMYSQDVRTNYFDYSIFV